MFYRETCFTTWHFGQIISLLCRLMCPPSNLWCCGAETVWKRHVLELAMPHIIIATTLCSTIISFYGFIANILSFNNEVTRSQACLVTKTVSFLNLLSNLGWSLYKVIKYNSSAAAAMELDKSQVYTTSTINFGNMNLNALTALLLLASTAICCGWKVALA